MSVLLLNRRAVDCWLFNPETGVFTAERSRAALFDWHTDRSLVVKGDGAHRGRQCRRPPTVGIENSLVGALA